MPLRCVELRNVRAHAIVAVVNDAKTIGAQALGVRPPGNEHQARQQDMAQHVRFV
jgi:hypothetical protein